MRSGDAVASPPCDPDLSRWRSCCLVVAGTPTGRTDGQTNLVLLKFVIVGFSGEKILATHSSTLARKIPWVEEPGRLQSRGL